MCDQIDQITWMTRIETANQMNIYRQRNSRERLQQKLYKEVKFVRVVVGTWWVNYKSKKNGTFFHFVFSQ